MKKALLSIVLILLLIPTLSFANNETIIIPIDKAGILETLDVTNFNVGISEDGKNYILTPIVKGEDGKVEHEAPSHEPEEIEGPTTPIEDIPTTPVEEVPPVVEDTPYTPPSGNNNGGNSGFSDYDSGEYDFSDFTFNYNPYADTDFSFYDNFDYYDYYDYFDSIEEEEYKPGDKFLKTGQTIQYIFKSEQKYPIYTDTGIKPKEGLIKFEELRDITRQIAIGKKTKVIEDVNKSMLLVDGKLIVIGENEKDVEKLVKKFNKTSVGILLQDTRAGGKFNVVDYMEIMKELKVRVNGEALVLISDPVIDNSKALIPIRSIAVSLGADVDWDGARREATITKANTKLVFKEDSDIVKVNNKNYLITHKTHIHQEDRRMLSVIKLLVTELGANMRWDSRNLELVIRSK